MYKALIHFKGVNQWFDIDYNCYELIKNPVRGNTVTLFLNPIIMVAKIKRK